MDNLLLVGVNHKVASISLRERLAFNREGALQALETLQGKIGSKDCEIALLSTCNRTEIIICTTNLCRAEEIVRDFLSDTARLSTETLADVLYVLQQKEAAEHLMRVAAGLDSLVVGENEIQGQVRNAHELAQTSGTSGPILDALFRAAVQTGKRVRTDTEIGKTKLSVATLVVELAEERLGDLEQHTALLIGAGKISTLTARELVKAGLRCVLVANRTFERAQKLADNLGADRASAVHFDQLHKNLVAADIVICSTGAPHIVLHKVSVIEAMKKRPDRPMLVADLAIPRDADPAIGDLANVELFAIDDLSELAQERHPLTAEALHGAERILEEELAFFERWCDARQAVPVIRSLRAKAETIVQSEIERTLNRMGTISTEQQVAIEHLGQAIINKLLHEPILFLKETPGDLDKPEVSELVEMLFGLHSFNSD